MIVWGERYVVQAHFIIAWCVQSSLLEFVGREKKRNRKRNENEKDQKKEKRCMKQIWTNVTYENNKRQMMTWK